MCDSNNFYCPPCLLTFFHIPLFFFYDVGRLTFFNSLVSFTSWLHWLRVPVLMSGGSVCACLLLQDFKNESWKRFVTSQRYETESELGFSFPMSRKNSFWIPATPMVSQKAVSQCDLWSGSQNVAYICFVFLFVSKLVRLRVVFFPPRMILKTSRPLFVLMIEFCLI